MFHFQKTNKCLASWTGKKKKKGENIQNINIKDERGEMNSDFIDT